MTAIDTKSRINRAPMLTLWAAVVTERLGFDHSFALTLGQAVAGPSAYAKGEGMVVDLLGRAVPVMRTPEGLRAVSKGKPETRPASRNTSTPSSPPRIKEACAAMAELAAAQEPATSTATASACMSRSDRRCPKANPAGVRRASSICAKCAAPLATECRRLSLPPAAPRYPAADCPKDGDAKGEACHGSQREE